MIDYLLYLLIKICYIYSLKIDDFLMIFEVEMGIRLCIEWFGFLLKRDKVFMCGFNENHPHSKLMLGKYPNLSFSRCC